MCVVKWTCGRVVRFLIENVIKRKKTKLQKDKSRKCYKSSPSVVIVLKYIMEQLIFNNTQSFIIIIVIEIGSEWKTSLSDFYLV